MRQQCAKQQPEQVLLVASIQKLTFDLFSFHILKVTEGAQ